MSKVGRAKNEYRINVYLDEFERSEVIARVRYNTNLDYWDGRNYSNGGTGMHKGLTKLRDGRYVVIITSQWQGASDYAYIVSAKEALQEILQSGSLELLKTKKFAQLGKMYKQEFEDLEDLEEEEI